MPHRPFVSVALLGVVTLAAACASSRNRVSTADTGCALRPQDSTFATHTKLYRDCAVESKAHKLVTGVTPDYRPAATANACVSAELEYVVAANGKPDESMVRIVRTTTPAFAEAALLIVPHLRYEPAKRDGVAVAQIVSEKFGMNPSTTPQPDPRC